MALPTSYMTGGYTKIPQYFDTLLTARAPEKFTNKFMADLGFTSSTDRLFANVLKSIGFLDDSGVPTERYFKFLDQSCSKQMVAEGVREAYEDLFNLNVTAYMMSQADVEGKFKTLTNGSRQLLQLHRWPRRLLHFAVMQIGLLLQFRHSRKPQLHRPNRKNQQIFQSFLHKSIGQQDSI